MCGVDPAKSERAIIFRGDLMRHGAPPSMTTSSRKLLPRAIIRDDASGKIIFEGGTAVIDVDKIQIRNYNCCESGAIYEHQ